MKRNLFLFVLFLGLSAAYAQLPSYVPTSGLQGYWPFTGNANDLSGHGHHGTVNGAVLTSDRFQHNNCAYSFNGISNFISTNYTGILGNNPRAVSFWAKTTNTQDGMYAVGWGDNQFIPNAGTRFACGFNGTSNGPVIGGADCYLEYASAHPVSDNVWRHYVFQFNGDSLGEVKIYQDNILLTQVTSFYNPHVALNTVNNFNVHFGKIVYPVSPAMFDGQIDDIGIWNRTLTTSEINALYHSVSTTGISALDWDNTISLFPNPAINTVTVNGLQAGSSIKVYTSEGKLIYDDIAQSESALLDVNKEASGLYFLVLSSPQGALVKKFIKQ